MSKNTQILEDLAYLELVGMTLDQLRSLHHWAGRPGSEERVTFKSGHDYFDLGHEMGANNSLFADRLHFVAEAHKRNLEALVGMAERAFPGSGTEPT
ncbi:hypothetical protein [Massilia antarctica]|uniref:hypothetical protein n=1 Tax=Massilia antarctica TaxID=2765360 RepID=UPI00226D7847|nr:hypothetical protein [Massilia sp. H27-R4]MCY0914037.1 hypothetical protein [Massilia sp. H27-R4]